MNRLILIPFFILPLALSAQHDNSQIEGEWLMPTSKKYNNGLIKLKDGKFQAEFFRQTNYLLKDTYLTIYANDSIAYSPTLNFKLKKVDSDSLILEASNLAAKAFVHHFNTFLVYDSTKKVNPLKLYRRELSFKKIKFNSIQLIRVKQFVLTIDSAGEYSVKLDNKKFKKINKLTQVETQQFDSCLYISNLESFKTPPKYDSNYKKGDRLVLFENSETVTIGLSERTMHGDYSKVPWTIKPLFEFLNSLAEKK